MMSWIADLLGAVLLTLSVSAYDNSQGWGAYTGLTRSGVMARPGMGACGPSLYLKTLFVWGLPGGPWVTCTDTGSAITDSHLDVWMESNEDARAWGRRDMVVLVLPLPTPGIMPCVACEGGECDESGGREWTSRK